MGNERAEELIRKYLEGTATPEEEALLESWYIAAAQSQPDMPGEPDYPKIGREILEPLLAGKPDQPTRRSPIRLWPRVAAAAAVIIAFSVGSFLIFHKRPAEPVAQIQQPLNDILPAGTKATLSLPGGRNISLDSVTNGTRATQGNVTANSLNGQLIYVVSPSDRPATAYNTLTTAPGEHYSLVLPDGTKVWLNAGSSITYPIAFNGAQRKVTVTGELYFEIAHNLAQPFRIGVKDQLVEDIGTHLNINAYDDEPTVKTTLIEGSIKIGRGSKSVTLRPGQQASMGPKDSSFQVKSVDANAATAWQNGYFYFDHADITTVMREFARWYNVKVVYKGDLPKQTFKGKVYRNINASEALSILSYFGAHFHIDGRTITVSS